MSEGERARRSCELRTSSPIASSTSQSLMLPSSSSSMAIAAAISSAPISPAASSAIRCSASAFLRFFLLTQLVKRKYSSFAFHTVHGGG